MQQETKLEINLVRKLTGATDEQIKFIDGGFVSRVYLINDGELVVKFPKLDNVDYRPEARVIDYLNTLELPMVSLQKVKWLSADGRCIVLYGVKGVPLAKIETLSMRQRQSIAEKIGGFLKHIRSLTPDFCKPSEPRNDSLDGWKATFDSLKDFYTKHFTKAEQAILGRLADFLPLERKKLGDKFVFTHGDIWNPNVLIDGNDNVGVIDCGDTGYHEESVDFGFEDFGLRDLVLDCVGADETLRRKVELRNDMLYITYPKFMTTMHGEDKAKEKCIPIIRGIIGKYRKKLACSSKRKRGE